MGSRRALSPEEVAMSIARKPKLDEEQVKILKRLRDAADDGEGELVHVGELQSVSGVFWIRRPLESLKRRGLVDHNGVLPLESRYWKITDAGREAIS
jgi:hypothetical protein